MRGEPHPKCSLLVGEEHQQGRGIVDFNDINKFAQAGYYLFLINEGHVTTIYPNENFKEVKDINVVQAGGKTGIMKITNGFSQIFSDKSIKCYIYLGHLKK